MSKFNDDVPLFKKKEKQMVQRGLPGRATETIANEWQYGSERALRELRAALERARTNLVAGQIIESQQAHIKKLEDSIAAIEAIRERAL